MCDFVGLQEGDLGHGEWRMEETVAASPSVSPSILLEMFGGENQLALTSSERELLRELEAEGLNQEAVWFATAMTAGAIAVGVLLAQFIP